MKRMHVHVSVNHLGFQVDTDEELRGMRAQLEAADARLIEENEQPCCYAKSDKYWVTDPTGIAWETFHTLGGIPVYGEDTSVFNHGASAVPAESPGAACCVPAQKTEAAPGAPPIDFIFTVCDNAAGEACPIWPGKPMTAHWGIADPAAVEGTDAQKALAFRTALKELETRIKLLTSLQIDSLDRTTLQSKLREIGKNTTATESA